MNFGTRSVVEMVNFFLVLLLAPRPPSCAEEEYGI